MILPQSKGASYQRVFAEIKPKSVGEPHNRVRIKMGFYGIYQTRCKGHP